MTGKKRIFLIVLLLLIPPSGLFIYSFIQNQAEQGIEEKYTEIDWVKLRKLNLKTKERPKDLEMVHGKPVKIPGFVVPLDDDIQGASEFLLVPSPQACIHVPPPPANQMILVRMAKGTPPRRDWGPVWVKGKLLITESETQFGKIAYKLIGEDSEKYQMTY